MELENRRKKTEPNHSALHPKSLILSSCSNRSFSQAFFPVQQIQIFPVKQVAFERLDYRINIPFRTPLIRKQILDAVPTLGRVIFALSPLVEELTVPLAHIFFIFLTVFYFHPSSPSLPHLPHLLEITIFFVKV